MIRDKNNKIVSSSVGELVNYYTVSQSSNTFTIVMESKANKTVGLTIPYDIKQVETATAAGTVTTAGNASVVVTSALFEGDETVSVPVALNDTANAIATAIRTALSANEVVSAHFVVGGATDKVILTAKVAAANDTTLNIAIADGDSVGVTTAATSANTTAGGVNNKSIAISGVPTICNLTVEIIATANPTLTWFNGITWSSGSAPTMTAGKLHKVTLFTRNGGTNWYGSVTSY